MKYKHYIGVDVSKHTIDVTVLKEGDFLSHEKVPNNKIDIRKFLKRIMKDFKARTNKTIVCVENTGTYTTLLLDELIRRKMHLWLESPLQIKLTLGLQRGKSDKLDSLRIAQYAYTYRYKSRLWNKPREIIEHLKQLRSLRQRLVVARYQLKSETKEISGYITERISMSVLQHCQNSLDAITKDIEKVSQTMMDEIIGDDRLNQLFQWISSVGGVGNVLAIELLVATNEFKNFTTSKKFACHCGVAPFRYTSGISLESKARVSRRANKRMKFLLHIASMSVIRHDNDYKRYFERRVAQGFTKMSVLNVIRNKIIHRVFACVREERCYIKNFEKEI